MTLSILHRITGVVLSVGLIALVVWLASIAFSAGAYAVVAGFMTTIIGKLLLLGWSFFLLFSSVKRNPAPFLGCRHGFRVAPGECIGVVRPIVATVLMTAGYWLQFYDLEASFEFTFSIGARCSGSGSAKSGTEHWWAQRVTAVALLILGGWFLYSIMHLDSFDTFSHARLGGPPVQQRRIVGST